MDSTVLADAAALLDRLDAFFDSPAKWTKKVSARSYLGTPVLYDDPSATCWCVTGAVAKIGYTEATWSIIRDELIAAIPHVSPTSAASVISFNDDPRVDFEKLKSLIAKARELVNTKLTEALRG